MTLPGVRMSSLWISAPPPLESESESESAAAGRRCATGCGLRIVMGIVR